MTAEGLFSSPTPFTPPTTEEDRLSWLRLIRSRRVGATTFHRMIAEHGSAGAALAALPEVARAAGVDDYAPCPPDDARREMAAARQAGARMLCHGAPGYPAALHDLADAPPILWALGDAGLLARPMVALVGARNASSLGTRMAKRLAEALGTAGFVVVSGLARGIDAAAHEAALAHGTVAVLGCGVDIVYPQENATLAAKIADQGCRLSEQPMGAAPQARLFPARNRLVSGLARAVVVVEAAARSGSLITARNALDQGRDVLAVPGHPFDARAGGCNMLIRDGATLVRHADDVVEALAPGVTLPDRPGQAPAASDRPAPRPRPDAAATAARAPNPALREVARLHQAILDQLGPSPVAEDQLIRDLALPAATLTPEILTLELEGKVRRRPGGLLSRAT